MFIDELSREEHNVYLSYASISRFSRKGRLKDAYRDADPYADPYAYFSINLDNDCEEMLVPIGNRLNPTQRMYAEQGRKYFEWLKSSDRTS